MAKQIESATVYLGDREFTIQTVPFARSRKWRKQLMEELKPVFDQVTAVQEGIAFEKPEDLLQLWPLLQTVLVDVIDQVYELLVAYSPVLEAEKRWIEENATEKQILAAFQEVLRLADPFGIFQRLGRRGGLMDALTSSSLPSVNGATAEKTQSESENTKD